MGNGPTFIDNLLMAVNGGAVDRDVVALRWFGDAYPGARGAHRGCRIREEVTFAALADRIERTAVGLRAVGMRPGERVLFSIRPRPEGIILCLAVIHAGGSIVFVDPGSTPELFEARLAAAGPRWAATEGLLYAVSAGPLARIARARGLLLPDYAQLPVQHLYAGTWLPGVPRGARRAARLAAEPPGSGGPVGGGSAGGGSAGGRPGGDGPAGGGSAGDREALVVFTSGTTSDPRAVVHTIDSLEGMLDLFAQVGDLRPGQCAHTDQMFLGLPALLAGGTWEIPARTPAADPAAFARGVAGADSAFAVPADVAAFLDVIESRPGGRAAAGPQVMAVGAAPVTPALMERANRLLPGTRWVCVYGATEMLPAVVVDGAEKARSAAATVPGCAATTSGSGTALPGCPPAPSGSVAAPSGDLIGLPLRGVGARIDAPDGDGVGELVLSGPSLMAGYLADLDAGRAGAAEHRTGDLATADETGRLKLVGRTRDMIIRGTVNIYPGLFEPRVRNLPGVAEALMVGVPMDDGDERVVLVLVADRGQADRSQADRGHADAGQANRSDVAADDEPPLTEDTPLVRTVTPELPGILDHGALPDLVVEAPRVPLSGRSRKPDRLALTAAAARLVGQSMHI